MAAAESELSRRTAVTVAITAATLFGACGQQNESRTRSTPGAGEPTRRVPPRVEQSVHRTFHRFERHCSSRGVDTRTLDRTTSDFIGWYRAYPPDQYAVQIDDEPGTMLSAILVLRYELSRCSPTHAALIDPILPREIRRGLRPLR